MLRRFAYAAIVLGVTTGFGLAQNTAVQPGGTGGTKTTAPTWGRITGIQGNKMTWQKWDPTTKKFADQTQTTTINPDALKIYQYGNNKYSPLDDGLKAKQFSKIGDEGLYAGFGMNGQNLGQIYLYPNQQSFMQGMQTFPKTGLPPGVGGTGGTGGTGGSGGGKL